MSLYYSFHFRGKIGLWLLIFDQLRGSFSFSTPTSTKQIEIRNFLLIILHF